MQTPDLEQSTEIFSVSELNGEVRLLLEENFDQIWVEGEISNFVRPGSGHWYFSLKDEDAQVRCAMFRGSQRGLGFTPKNGMHVLLRARISLYEARGDYQLIADFMEERGEGKLRRKFEALKKKLSEAGWFDEDIKQDIPQFPKQIGVVTSATGAAVRDILNVLKRRYPCVPVIIYPTLVQGDKAAPEIAKAIKIANQRKECDVLIVARGGGSLEDLWPFNEEVTAKAIYESLIPVISGVGHEVDFTIADFVADLRAPTPSAAAELATPDKDELISSLREDYSQLLRHIRLSLKDNTQELAWLKKHLDQQHPQRRITERIQQLDFAESKFVQLQQQLINQLQLKTGRFATSLQQHAPNIKIQKIQQNLQNQLHHLNTSIRDSINQQQSALANSAAKLDGISPLSTLKRGYAIASKGTSVVTSSKQVKQGDHVSVRLQKGELDCVVDRVLE